MENLLKPRNALMAVGAIAIAGAIAVGAFLAMDNDASASDKDKDPGTGSPTLPVDGEIETVKVPAPILEADVNTAESFPPQYFLRVVSEQSDGCHEFAGYTVTRDGNKVIVDVQNTRPADMTVVLCLMIYKTTESNIALGSDFEPGETYEVIINGEKVTEFEAQ